VRRAPLLVAALGLLCGVFPVSAPVFGSGAAENVRSIIDSGHAGAVRWIEADEKRGFVFTAGDDGTVRIWDRAAGSLVRVLHVTQLSVVRIAVNPSAPQVAVVVTDGSASFLSVWDWEKERQLYRLGLKEDPAFLRYSGQGTYVLFGESSWQGLKIIRSEDGSLVPFHPEGFGIVGFAELSRTEKTLMTYQVSGRISYWDLATGDQTLDVPTVPYLSGIRIWPDRGSLVGYSATEIVRVDAVSGAVRGRAPIPGVVSFDLSPAGDELTCIAGPARQVTRWATDGDSFSAADAVPALPQPPAMVAYGPDAVFFAGSSAGLFAVSSTGDVTEFGGNVVADLTGFDAGEGRVALGSRDWVRVFSSASLDGSAPLTALRTMQAPNPFSDAAGLAFLGQGRLLAWGAGSSGAPPLASLDTAMDAGLSAQVFAPIPSPFRAPLADLRAAADELLGIETSGTLRIVDPVTGASRFDTRISGAGTAVHVSAGEVVAARNSSGGSAGSLLRINMVTGETVTIRGRDLFTYALLLDRGSSGRDLNLYSIGIDSSRSTNLLRHDGAGFEKETVLDSIAEEDLDASLCLDPDQHVLYGTLGRDRVVAWDGKSLRSLTVENSAPHRLAARGKLLFSVNKDSTVTVADAQTGARRAQIALFKDGEWCIVFSDGSYAASTGGDMHVRVFVDGSPVKATEDYRLHIDTR
jgi:WD40 repeat protein